MTFARAVVSTALLGLLAACGSGGQEAGSLSSASPVLLAEKALAPATITVSNVKLGSTPAVLGYNSAHGMSSSNAKDWWRYSGVKAARVFISVSDIEPSDDIDGVGDGVVSRASFEARRDALRSNASNPAVALDPQFINWSRFETAYNSVATGNNRFSVNDWFPVLRSLDVEILAAMTASPSRFPLAGASDYANMWELWQHYYAQAFKLSRDFDVRRFSMFNEPNNWPTPITVEDWALRLRICSDAIQSAVADMNARYGRSLAVEILAPNTANGATKYDDPADYWGKTAITERNLDIWGGPRSAGSNLNVYNYQKYSMDAASYLTDFDLLKSKIAADMGGNALPMTLTEYNVRTGSSYDATTATADSPADFAALGANSIALSERGADLYLFKFGMTDRSGNYPVAKNGTHHVNNDATGVNHYGGAASTAEVYRLFVKASGRSRDRLKVSSSLGSEVFVQATTDPVAGARFVYIANRGTTSAAVDIDLGALGVAEGSLVTVEEVSTTHKGGIARATSVAAGRVPAATMPPQSVWLVSVYDVSGTAAATTASADAALSDGSGRNVAGASTNPMVIRADGTMDGRRLAVIRFPVPISWTPGQRVLLSLNAATTAGNAVTHCHVYGLEDDSWTESVSFSGLKALKQGVGAGNLIANNVLASPGTLTRIQGQLLVNSTTAAEKLIDVTAFVTSQTDGFASFLVVQEHRFDVRLPDLASGDTQAAGVNLASRESANPPTLRIHGGSVATAAPAITTQPASQSVQQGATVTFSVVASGNPTPSYQWRKDGVDLPGATSASLVLTSVTATSAGAYSVTVRNAYGEATSTAATLTVSSPARYDLSVALAGTSASAGSVTSAPAGIACGSDCTETYTAGTSVTLTAKVGKGGRFTGWSGACSGTASTCTVTLSANRAVTATFAKR